MKTIDVSVKENVIEFFTPATSTSPKKKDAIPKVRGHDKTTKVRFRVHDWQDITKLTFSDFVEVDANGVKDASMNANPAFVSVKKNPQNENPVTSDWVEWTSRDSLVAFKVTMEGTWKVDPSLAIDPVIDDRP